MRREEWPVPGYAFGGYYLFYYVDVLGLAVALTAIVNVVYAIWDAVNDPLVGYLADNTRTRWGRRRPWLLILLQVHAGGRSTSAVHPLWYLLCRCHRCGLAVEQAGPCMGHQTHLVVGDCGDGYLGGCVGGR